MTRRHLMANTRMPFMLISSGYALLIVVIHSSAIEKTDPDLEQIKRLMDIAWSNKQRAVIDAKNAYESYNKRTQDRSRWHYAYAVANVRLKKYEIAADAFQKAINESDQFDFRSWQGLVFSKLNSTNEKQKSEGLDKLKLLAETVNSEAFRGTPDDRSSAALWIGKVIAAREKISNAKEKQSPAKERKIQVALLDLDTYLKGVLSEELRAEYERGRTYSITHYEQLDSNVNKTEQQRVAEMKKNLEFQASRTQSEIDKIQSSSEQVKKLTEEQMKLAKQQVSNIDRQILRLEREYKYLDTQSIEISNSLTLLKAEHGRIRAFGAAQGNLIDQSFVERQNYTLFLEQLYQVKQGELETTEFRLWQVMQQGIQQVNLREETIRQINQVEAKSIQEVSTLETWKKRLDAKKEHLDEVLVKGDIKPPTPAQKRLQLNDLNTYLNFDLENERQRLTGSN